jgi:hypothetical protein
MAGMKGACPVNVVELLRFACLRVDVSLKVGRSRLSKEMFTDAFET